MSARYLGVAQQRPAPGTAGELGQTYVTMRKRLGSLQWERHTERICNACIRDERNLAARGVIELRDMREHRADEAYPYHADNPKSPGRCDECQWPMGAR